MMDNKQYRKKLQSLKDSVKNGDSVTLFLGAGINSGEGIHLLWNDLVSESCIAAFRRIFLNEGINRKDGNTILEGLGIIKTGEKVSATLKRYLQSQFPVEVQVSLIKTMLKVAYIPSLRSYLYTQCNNEIIRSRFAKYRKNQPTWTDYRGMLPLFMIAKAILLSNNISKVITYNYDNFVSSAVSHLLKNSGDFFTQTEVAFLLKKYKCDNPELLKRVEATIDIYKENNQGGKLCYQLPIYHVHGFIPPFDRPCKFNETSIVLSLDEYCETLNISNSWQSSVQLESLISNTCIFIGSSLTDLTTKRLLNYRNTSSFPNQVFVLDGYNASEDDTALPAIHRIKDLYLKSMGINFVDCPEGFDVLYRDFFDSLTSNLPSK